MRYFVLPVLLLITSLTTYAQPAPDFTITDSQGQQHQLYADYLNQGKSVLIKVFFTTCPPCNAIAPLMEPLYQEWGAGDYDVEFFELSDKNFDTDALVNAYKAQYNSTFIAAGVEGGSIAAVQPYKSGLYGQWFGTPTFIVIAPNGTVTYDVSGNGNQGTIDAIDAALIATGAVKPGGNPLLAPDFTLTDVEDEDHTLYADYLSQGKTVVLEIYNSTSGASIAMASLLQPLYEAWGGGDGDVEFITLTDRTLDDDQVVFDFQITHHQTFPGISDDGGSVPATTAYKNGTFGPWMGAPTFVVISPDGTVQYDVRGANEQATINELNEAIAATGASPGSVLTQAPDFTITDIHGAQHSLYADYLNQGKSVMLEVFYTTCPPCNAISPLLEPLYQAWGAGEHDVEFIALSDKNFDTNLLIDAFQDQHGETFVAAGVQGGSLNAVNPYKNGSFGNWQGTPLFIVIAPDGSVNYDVNGVNNAATIEAIDAALLATGAQKPGEEIFTVSGQITFLDGTAGVNNAIMQIVNVQGNVLEETTSDANGNFSLQLLQSEVQPDWQLKATKNSIPLNGVSTLDLVRIQKHLLGIQRLETPVSKLASDANRSGTISALDIVLLSRILLNLTNNFPDQETWITVPADTDFGVPTQHPPVIESYTIPVTAIINGQRAPHFIAIKKGDATGNANPN
jgi:thiol-disulfide isomerase/thioredoxin